MNISTFFVFFFLPVENNEEKKRRKEKKDVNFVVAIALVLYDDGDHSPVQ